eukprot:Protomagalhaensia_wolfi_Nauph_80__5843@NODE_740_length_2047_cov_151_914841_g554_i0_p3_GENE_NODE_740_length_2047_cov_151_914841_g554_i0NODE_740_length_2047_cov_151_914841_g554_i0_p3_ORF_typecomplete_len145_score16_05DUF4050/PF13259_6/0_0076_NODE_740_length_2047_cov_151_914841_g554_i015371971
MDITHEVSPKIPLGHRRSSMLWGSVIVNIESADEGVAPAVVQSAQVTSSSMSSIFDRAGVPGATARRRFNSPCGCFAYNTWRRDDSPQPRKQGSLDDIPKSVRKQVVRSLGEKGSVKPFPKPIPLETVLRCVRQHWVENPDSWI